MPLYKSLSDAELTGLLKSGDKKAFTEIFDRYWEKAYLHALRMLEDDDEAKDLVQELFSSLWEKSQELQFDISLSGYLYVMTRNRCLNHIRQRKNRTAFEDALSLYIEKHQYSVLEVISEKELSQALDAEIVNLPPKMREIFVLSRKKYLSHREIGLALHISDRTVKKQISNALKIIRVKMDRSWSFLLLFYYLFR